ncbi:MAG TPA: type IV secretion system DNA-binding domain-containing protein [Patescibacteria group bacterium]|nr:type IV secretion system DNA-binding domain-containing protein [Patescibacteria group bacterium]
MDLNVILAELASFVLVSVFFLGVVVLLLIGGILIFLQYLRFRNREDVSLNFVLLEIAVPRDNETKIDAAEQIFASLHSIKQGGFWQRFKAQQHLSFEIVAKKEDIRFYVSCHRNNMELTEKLLAGAYPGVQVKEVEEYNIFTETGKVAFSEMVLRNESYKPIKVYKELTTDPLASITASLAKLGADEAAAIQIIVVPAESEWQKAGESYISKTKRAESDPEKAKFKMSPADFEAIDNKVGKPGFLTAVRIVTVASTEGVAKQNLSNLKGAFSQLNGSMNGFKGKKIRFKNGFMVDFVYRYQSMFGNNSVLNTEELATIWHMPNKTIETPHIYWLGAKSAPATGGFPDHGLFLGRSIYRGQERPIFISDEDRMKHVYIIGRTGTGKTELLKTMILQDMRAGKGLCFLEPHGDGIEELLELVPPERAEDVIIFDPSDTERPVGFNLLAVKSTEEMMQVSSAIINLMYKLYDPHKTGMVGPRFEHSIRNAMLTVAVQPGASFVEVVRALTDDKYVQELLPKVTDPIVRRYWTDQIAKTDQFHKSETLDYIVSKFGKFITNKMVRNIIGQSSSTLDFRKAMDEGKIVFLKLAKGLLGEEDSNFLGLILVPKVLQAALSRQDIPKEQRRPFYLYVDEFQNFATPDFAQMLSEARKYGLGLVLANQFVSQLEESVKDAVFGNIGTLMSYRVGVPDASVLQHEFAPVFNETDLANVGAQNIYVKTVIQGSPVPPFSMNVYKDIKAERAQGSKKVAEMIRELSRLKYGRDREEVEAEIERRAKL